MHAMEAQQQSSAPEATGATFTKKDMRITHDRMDSMVTVRLSERLSTDSAGELHAEVMANNHNELEEEGGDVDREDSTAKVERPVSDFDTSSHRSTIFSHHELDVDQDMELKEDANYEHTIRRDSDDSIDSDDGQVNWEELEKTEGEQPRDQDSDDSTALLLARLEQENNALVTNPKSALQPIQGYQKTRARKGSRPPSMQQLKEMVSGPTPAALRYSLIPAPPMTDLEFYGALVQDYKRTAHRLPTLLSKKIRGGVPPPLRGVVWQSMCGARDRMLEDTFERLVNETSPYEGIIGKDLGRSFPGVEMFRDPEGDGQKMLGRVLKCFSLYDTKIGYCQGLGFLVGPLLMHMPDREAFCVLVRLMENYDLRNCFLPDLSGLHVRTYQFRELLKKHLPVLNNHLDYLQVEPAYVSQWFLSFFAVTCPLPMLFRIYDVIFAEGVGETIMRVALAVMRKNEEKILACTEFEDVMQLLLSRGLWDCYHYNADDFVNDFVSLTSIVTNDTLRALESGYTDQKVGATSSPTSENIGTAASRFLGRLWAGAGAGAIAGSNSSLKSQSLSPSVAGGRPVSFLRRSPSKQSIASTLDSVEGGTDSIISSGSVITDTTNASRDSSNTEASSLRAASNTYSMFNAKANQEHNLHGQIEDLLTALSELQRDHAILATQLQREREEREEDHTAMRALLDTLKINGSIETMSLSDSEASLETVTPSLHGDNDGDDQDTPTPESENPLESHAAISASNVTRLLENVEDRIAVKVKDRRRSSMMHTKAQLREDLARSKEQLITETSRAQELSRRLIVVEQELSNVRDELKESHMHARGANSEKQRLQKQVFELREDKKRTQASAPDTPSEKDDRSNRASIQSNSGGLRELRLGRTSSNQPRKEMAFGKRTSSLGTMSLMQQSSEESQFRRSLTRSSSGSLTPQHVNDGVDVEAMILELVQAKTARVIAEQEAEDAKAKLANFKRLLAGGVVDAPAAPPSNSFRDAAEGFLGYGRGSSAEARGVSTASLPPVVTPPAVTTTNSGGGWFGGGWGKRSTSTASVHKA